MQFRSYQPLFFRLAASSLISVIEPFTPRRAISVLVASYSSSSSSYGQFTSRCTKNEEDSRSVKVSVWWDFENCHLPAGSNVFKLAQTIRSAIRISGIKGPINITAFGDLMQLSRTNQEALSETGIILTHVPQGGKNSTDRSLITDLMCWVLQNPPPAHVFLISSDRDFASMLHRLRMNNYNILLAGNEEATSSVLCSAASIMWDWDALVRGKISTGKHFNDPPDGPYSSWYGHYTTPLLDPFATTKQQSCTSVKNKDLRVSNSKEVVKQISLILRCYPKGACITALREQLSKRNVRLDREFYGHKSFSRFLLSMPKILQVVPLRDGMFLIHAVTQEMDNKAPSLKLSSENPKVLSVGNKRQKMNQNDEDVKSKDESVKENQRALIVMDDKSSSKEKDGFFKKLTRRWFGSPEMESRIVSSTSNESAMEVKANTEVGNEKTKSPGLLSQLLKRFIFSRGKNTKLSIATATRPLVDDDFAKDSSWKDLKSFINSPRGLVVVSHSRSRETMAKNLKDEGPSFLKPLGVPKMLDLLALLISEKKWIKENNSDALPFRVTQITEKSSGLTNPQHSVGLRSIFVNMSKSLSDEASGEYKSKNIAMSQKPTERSRSEVIADCHRLIKKITEENPGGYNMALFKKDFMEKFGYPLDYHNLGYPKLQSLIKMIPEVRIVSGHIVPSSLPVPYKSDSSSEELGPVSGKIQQYESSDSVTNEEACVKQCSDDERKKQKDNETKNELLQILGDFDKKQKNLEEENFDSDINEEACLKQCSDDKRKKQKDNETKSELPQILGGFDKKQNKNLEEENFDSHKNEEACLKQSSGNKKKKQKDNEIKSEVSQILGGFHKKPAKTLGDDKPVEGILTSLRKTSSSESKIQD